MPSSKTDASVQFPSKEEQTRRLRNTTTQDRKAVGRMQAESGSARARSEAAKNASSNTWPSVEENLETTVDKDGHPVPDRAFIDYDEMKKHQNKPYANEFDAANKDFD